MNVTLKRVGGAMKVDIDGRLYEPLSFKSFRPTDRNISDFYKAGVRLFSVLTSGLICMLGVPYSLFGESWTDDGVYDFGVIDRQMDLFIKNAPEGYFAVMLDCNSRRWYCEKHGVPYTFTHLSQTAADETWRRDTADYLEAAVSHIEEKYGERIYGYFLLGGMTTEWFSEKDYMAPHPIKEKAYQAYKNDANAVIPPKEVICKPRTQAFYGEEDAEAVDYARFHNELISDTILYFASRVKALTNRQKLVGVYYGYLFELGGPRLFNAGSLDYMKVFDSPDIDMISSPSSYEFRKHIDCSAYMVTYNTLDKRDKLYYLEFDHRTHLAPMYADNSTIMIPGADSGLKNNTESVDVMRRDFVLTLTGGAALWWFDMFEGWFYSDEMMGCVKQMISISESLRSVPMKDVAEIAVFAAGHSLYGVNKESRLNDPLLGRQRGGLAYLGAPYDVFDTSDIVSADLSRYKLIIFEDAFSLTGAEREAIDEKCKTGGKTILWCYAPGYTDGGLAGLRDLTGMNIGPYAGEGFTASAFGTEYGFDTRYDTMFASSDGEVLGTYADGAGALVRKTFDTHTSVYSALGDLPGKVLKEIARDAGVFIYSDTDDLVYVNSDLVGVCSDHDGDVTVHVPYDASLAELFGGEEVQTENGSFTVTMRKGEVRLYKKEK